MIKFKYPNYPPDAKCPYCGEYKKPCSYVNSLSRAWARDACSKKHNNIPLEPD